MTKEEIKAIFQKKDCSICLFGKECGKMYEAIQEYTKERFNLCEVILGDTLI